MRFSGPFHSCGFDLPPSRLSDENATNVSLLGWSGRTSVIVPTANLDPFRTKVPYRKSHSARMDAKFNGIYLPAPSLRLARERKRQ
jgi:hypothetical protein